MQDSFTQKQDEVLAAYDEFVHSADPRQQTAYMATKFQVDYRLLNMVSIRDKQVLNVGCAFPIDELYYAGQTSKWVAVDLSKESVTLAETIVKRELCSETADKIHFQLQDATALQFEDDSFDVSLSFSTFDHIPSHEKRQAAINELARVTRPGGHVIITVPNRKHVFYYARSKSQQKRGISHYGYEYCFSPRELKSMLLAADLKPGAFISTFSYRELDPNLSPFWQRPLISVAIMAINSLRYFGHRMGYLATK